MYYNTRPKSAPKGVTIMCFHPLFYFYFPYNWVKTSIIDSLLILKIFHILNDYNSYNYNNHETIYIIITPYVFNKKYLYTTF